MRLIVFDVDGTLVDSAGLIVETAQRAFAEEGLAVPDPDFVREGIGLSLFDALHRLAPDADLVTVERLVQAYRRHYQAGVADARQREPLFEGTEVTLRGLHAQPDTLLAIATGKAFKGVERLLSVHGLTDLFVSIQTPDHNPSKPHPGMLRRAMAETGADIAGLVMIGDSTYDMEMARAIGAAAIGVTWGYHAPDALTGAGARRIVSRFGELPAAIDALLGGADA